MNGGTGLWVAAIGCFTHHKDGDGRKRGGSAGRKRAIFGICKGEFSGGEEKRFYHDDAVT